MSGKEKLSVETQHLTNEQQMTNVVSPVSPAPEYIDQLRLEAAITKFRTRKQQPEEPVLANSPPEEKAMRDRKARAFVRQCMAMYLENAQKWKSVNPETKEIRGVFEGAIAAGKTTFSKAIAKHLERTIPNVKVNLHEEKVPPKSLKVYYQKRAEMDPLRPIHIPEAAQIQFYIMANRIAQFAQFSADKDKKSIHLQDRLFGDIHFMACNIRDGIVNDEEIETYLPLWYGVCAALPLPDFVVILEPPGDTIVQNNRTRMENLRTTATKMLGILCDGSMDPVAEFEHSFEGKQLAMEVSGQFSGITSGWNVGCDWMAMFGHVIELRERNGEGSLSADWLRKHAEDYLETMRIVESHLKDHVQFVHVTYEAPKFPVVSEVIDRLKCLKGV